MGGTSIVPGRGRKPKPVAKKAAAGNPGKRALNTVEPNFGKITNIDPPDWMGETAKQIWAHLAPLLCDQEILQPTDIHNLELFCSAYGRFREAEKEIASKGVIVEGAQGGWVKNPAATIINEASRQMATFGTLLGLDPSSRQRLLGPKKKNGGNSFAGILAM